MATARRETGWAVDPKSAKIAGAIVLGGAVLTAFALLADGALSRRRQPPAKLVRERGDHTRGLHAAAALLALSVFADSSVEHYRGNFENPGMYTPLAVSALSMAAGLDGAVGRKLPPRVRTGVYGLASVVGAVGVGFHVYNLLRRPGGLSWLNAFYAAPVGAPAALSIAGLLGAAAENLDAHRGAEPKLLGFPAGRMLSALTGASLMGTVSEVGLLHFRGSFQNPFMWLPVSLPPVAAVLMGKAALEPSGARRRPLTRTWLWATAALGIGGVGFHAYGVSRAMGGWRNWSQNVIDGPPLPAPPSFSALAIAAFSALALRDDEHG